MSSINKLTDVSSLSTYAFSPRTPEGGKIAFLKTPLFDELMRLRCFTPGHRAPGLGCLRFVLLRVADFSHRGVACREYAV